MINCKINILAISHWGHSSEKERRIPGKNVEFAANLQADSILINMMIHQI